MNDLAAGIVFGILALFLLYMAARTGFFKFDPVEWPVPINLFHLMGAFAIYFLGSSALPNIVTLLFRKNLLMNHMSYVSWLNFSLSFFIFILLYLYFLCLPKKIRNGIWRRHPHPMIHDVWFALYAWIIAFPLVLFINQTLEYLVTKVFHLAQLPDQIAVKFLKSTFEYPLYFVFAIVSIILLAPLVEEMLFRGFLQTYIRRHLGTRQAIVITSLCFAFFHYAAGQGFGNIAIILSLFILSLFIGFVYEKKGSLVAPMVLHGAFNAISVINLYLFEGKTPSV